MNKEKFKINIEEAMQMHKQAEKVVGHEIPLEPINSNNEKHLKGYMFDSLVYRYQLALEQRVETLARQYIWSGKFNEKREAEAYVRQHENKRDLMAFIRILDEAIGDHD